MFQQYEPVMHNTKGKGRIIGSSSASFEYPWTVELEAGGTCLAATNELTSLGPPPDKMAPRQCPKALTEGAMKFKQGDLVPDWVLKANDANLQKEATFVTDVRITWNGRVVVTQTEETFPPLFDLIEISEEGRKTEWAGYPTEFKPKLKDDSSGD